MKSAPSFEAIRGEIRFGESMAKHTTWRVGGPADYWFVPEDKTDLAAFLAVLPEDVPLLWTGLGSNLLVRDGGIRGAVVCTHQGLSSIKTTTTDEVDAGAGAACAKVARYSAHAGLAGAEFMAGIPGTVGGALAMNAGAHGGETWDIVAYFALIHDRFLMVMVVLDRILDRYNVTLKIRVYKVNHCCEGCRFS